jgi:hypothetical protein
MGRHSYAEMVKSSKVMLAGLKANPERVEKRGITPEFLTEYQQIFNDVMEIHNEQEAMKARMKEKTLELKERIKVMELKYREAKKMVKVEFPQVSWKEFGIYNEW